MAAARRIRIKGIIAPVTDIPILRLFFRLLLAKRRVISPVAATEAVSPRPLWLTAPFEGDLFPFKSIVYNTMWELKNTIILKY